MQQFLATYKKPPPPYQIIVKSVAYTGDPHNPPPLNGYKIRDWPPPNVRLYQTYSYLSSPQ